MNSPATPESRSCVCSKTHMTLEAAERSPTAGTARSRNKKNVMKSVNMKIETLTAVGSSALLNDHSSESLSEPSLYPLWYPHIKPLK